MLKRKRKCVAWSKQSLFCDGCHSNATKCPLRNKYRDLRNTKYGKELYRHKYRHDYNQDDE